MKSYFNKSGILLLPVAMSLLAGCAGLRITPPSPEQQSLLVLPVTLDQQSQYGRHGFVYMYEINSEDDSLPPYQAVFKLPIKGDMLIVDSLPPGKYSVTEFSFKTRGSGDFSYGDNVQVRNDRFQLLPDKITIFQQSLNVRVYNATPGRGMSSTYDFKMQALSALQKQGVLATLQQLDNFDSWEIADKYIPVRKKFEARVEHLQLGGRWSGSWQAQLDSSSDGSACSSGRLNFNIEGGNLTGWGESNQDEYYEVSGTVDADGVVRGEISTDSETIANIKGKTRGDDEVRGKFVFTNGCLSTWMALAGA